MFDEWSAEERNILEVLVVFFVHVEQMKLGVKTVQFIWIVTVCSFTFFHSQTMLAVCMLLSLESQLFRVSSLTFYILARVFLRNLASLVTISNCIFCFFESRSLLDIICENFWH